MTVLPIRKYGDPVLREKAKPIREFNEELRRLSEDMGETMRAASGIGLAGNQIGRAEQILVLDVAEIDERPKVNGKRAPAKEPRLEVYLNPEILSSSDEDEEYNEGCLSIPGVEADVFRPLRIRLRWTDLDGKQHEDDFDGLRARVLQHEIDHLNGVMFVDHLGMIARAKIVGKLNKLKMETMKAMGVEDL